MSWRFWRLDQIPEHVWSGFATIVKGTTCHNHHLAENFGFLGVWIEYRGKVILWHLQAMYHFHEAIPITTKLHWQMLLDSDSNIGSRPFSGSVAGGSCFSHSYCAGRILGEDILALVCGYTFHLIPFWPIALGKTSVSDQGIGRLRWFGLPVRPCSQYIGIYVYMCIYV